MSGSSSLSTAAFSDAEKADVRRFCGYPPYGIGSVGFQGWRFFQAYGTLEYRMNNFAPAELQIVRYYLALLYPLETAITAASGTLNVGAAGPFTRNPAELRERRALYNATRRELAANVGVPPGPLLGEAGVRVVV